VPNPDLAPEISTNREFGFKSESEFGQIDVSLFKNNIEDFIIYEVLDPVLFTGRLANVEKVAIKGAEISHNIDFNTLNINSNISFIDTENTSTHSELLRRPNRLANINFTYQFGKLSTSLGAHGESSRKDIDSVTFLPSSLPGFVLANAQVTYQVNAATNLQLKANNILDKQYQMIDGYNSDRANFMLSMKTLF